MRGDGEEASTAFAGMTPGHCRWNELVTSDQAAALDFYIDQFGWEKGDAMPMGEAGDYRFIDHHGEMIGAVMNRMDGKQRPMWNYYFGVPDIDKRSEEHTSELQSLMRISYAVFCLKKKKCTKANKTHN